MKKNSAAYIMLRLIVLVRPLLPIMLLAVLSGAAGQLTALLIPVLGSAALLGYMGLLQVKGTLLLGGILFCAVARGFFRYAEQEANHYIAFRILAMLRDRVFSALRRLGPSRLEGRSSGDILTIITRDIELLEVFYAHTISPVCIAILISIFMTAFQLYISPLFGIIAALGYISVGILLPKRISLRAGKAGEGSGRRFSEINSFFLESLRGIKQCIQYECGEDRLRELRKLRASMEKEEERLAVQEGIGEAVNGSMIYGFTLFNLLCGIWLLSRGEVVFSELLLSTIALFSSFGAVTAVSRLGTGLSRTIASGKRVLELLSERPDVEEQAEGERPEFKDVKIQSLCFSYGKDEVLSDVDFSINKGEIVGIMGRSGCGKSTLLKLLMRFYDRDSGELRISGTDIKEINTEALRGMESYLTQETVLFNDSIENNIRIAGQDAEHEEIVAAAKKASIHDFIMGLPQGYDTNVGELGGRLSEGEKQRLGLARAFLHRAPLLLLDEPSSNIDSLNEAVILKSVCEENDRTVVLVSHRPSTLQIADVIYKMQDGRIKKPT